MGYNVAIDGPAGAGKSTIAKSVFAAVNARQLNTCLFYFTHVPNLNFEHIFLTFKKQSLAYDYTHIIFPV